MSDDRIRWTMSLRERDDKLIEHFSESVKGDRSAECRRLMYLGLELEGILVTLGLNREQLLGRLQEMSKQEPEQVVPVINERFKKPKSENETMSRKELLTKRLDALM